MGNRNPGSRRLGMSSSLTEVRSAFQGGVQGVSCQFNLNMVDFCSSSKDLQTLN